MHARALLAAMLGLTLSGCSSLFSVINTPAICEVWRPVYPSRKDKMTEGTVVQIAENNAANVVWCGKRRPPNKPQKLARADNG